MRVKARASMNIERWIALASIVGSITVGILSNWIWSSDVSELKTLLVLIAVTLGSATTFFIATWAKRSQDRLAQSQLYAPLLKGVTEFFETAGQSVVRRNFRELRIHKSEEISELVYCALGKLVPVEEVQGAFRAHQQNRRVEAEGLGYLVYPGELDPAAARQLDVYRLRENTVIIPLPLAFLEAKRNEGPAAARAALDGLRRRYLGFQDLFDVRNAIDEPRFFYGRRELLADLFNALTRGEHVALIGPRKSGKTSALNLLQQRLTSFPVVKIDLQLFSRSQDWPAELFAKILELYDHWGQARYGSKWKPQPMPSPLTGMAFCHAVQQRRDLQNQASGPLPLILLLDEMERIFPHADDPGTVREHAERFIAAAGALRSLGQESGERLISIIAADPDPVFNRTNRFAQGLDTNPFYRFFQECFLPPLNAEECDEMLRDIGHAMGLELDDEVRQAVFSDSGGHAALARQLASAACRQRDGAAKVTADHYRAGLEWLTLETGTIDNDFEKNLWHESSPAEKRVLALAAPEEPVSKEALEEPGPVPVIDSEAAHKTPTPTAKQLREARRMLLATGMLEASGRRYRVRGALFRSWLRENVELPCPAPTRRPSAKTAGHGVVAHGPIHAKPAGK